MIENCITGGNDYLYNHMQESIQKAKSIDIIVSFIMESGVKLLKADLENIDVPIRILTGNYLNITQPSALYMLKDILGSNLDLRFYNNMSVSFHPKAYIFNYENGGEIFIGSSNLSRSAFTKGIEWNFRIDSKNNQKDFDYFKNKFEELFNNESIIVNDYELEAYSKSWKKPKLFSNMKLEQVNKNPNIYEVENVVNLFEPRGAQIEALYNLKKTRKEGNDKALVVAATGIGKTYLAAFDSREFNRILFIAHREEILYQAYDSFKNIRTDKLSSLDDVMSDYFDYERVADEQHSKTNEKRYIVNMGFFIGNKKDINKDIIFASVQTLGKKEYLNEAYFSRDYFDYIIIDEFHHAVTKNYQNIIDYFRPKFLLGLTATPNRLDNKDVFAICDYNTVYNLSLNSAIDKGWLVPFRYYAVYDDSVNYDGIAVKNGMYDEAELEKMLSINKRADLIFKNYIRYNSNMAIGFCTNKNHASYMAKYFNENGINSAAVYSGALDEYAEDRKSAVKKLKTGEIKIIFCVDMFNEGVDIKDIDLVMFLRPTESQTVFLQQLGRGLRVANDKKYLNVLDFIGNYKKAYLKPYFLAGKNEREIHRFNDILKDENYPDDCLVNFDFRIIDLFEQMRKVNISLEEIILEEIYRIKEMLCKIPNREEFFTYLEDDIYEKFIKKENTNPFADYLRFLYNNEIAVDELYLPINSDLHKFINYVENVNVNGLVKLAIFNSFINEGNIKLSVTKSEIIKSFRAFYSIGTNKAIFREFSEQSDFEDWTDKKIGNYLNSYMNEVCDETEFFYQNNDLLEINLDYINEAHLKNIKNNLEDVIKFRKLEYYKYRFEDIDLQQLKRTYVEFALRDERVNIFSMVKGRDYLKYSYEIMLCKKNKLPERPYLLDMKKSNAPFALSDEGKKFQTEIKDEELKLKFIAFIDSYIKVRIDNSLFEAIYNNCLFSTWMPKAPQKYFEGSQEGYIVLFRVYEIKGEIDECLLEKGRRGRNSFFKFTQGVELKVKKPILDDSEFEAIKKDIIDVVSGNGNLIEVEETCYEKSIYK